MYRSFPSVRMTTKRNPVILNEVKDLYAALSCGIEGYFLSSASTQPTTFREEPIKREKHPRDRTGESVVTGMLEYVVVLARLRQCLDAGEWEPNDGEYIPYFRLLVSEQFLLVGV